MKQHSRLAVLLAEHSPVPSDRCATCQRSGLPILPLRSAFATPAGDMAADVSSARLGQLRTLRQGYLYVLLDAQVWQAYAVTEQGLLRQFVPQQMPLDPPAPITELCVRDNHHLPASFINIDTALYSKAWFAFANDPWPSEVLDRYKQAVAAGGSPLEARFREIDLAVAREQPAQLGIAMTAELVGLDQVLEFATPQLDNFTSAHGFCTRWMLPHVFQEYIQTLIEREKLPQGVLALTLDDPVGVVQELNAQRLAQFEAMQQWRAEPQRRFEYFTSQTLLGLRAAYERSAEAQAEEAIKEERAHRDKWNSGSRRVKTTLPPVNAAAVTAQHRKKALARLEERYDESARAAFETNYQSELDRWQQSVDDLSSLYAQHSTDPLFALITENDYIAHCPLSAQGFILMVSAVLGGGPTERLPDETEPLGPTQALWQRLLEDTSSLFYQSLVAKHRELLEQIKTGLAGDDLGKTYDTVKSLITSDDGKKLMTEAVQNASAQLLAAANNAQHTLGPRLSQQARALVGHLHSIAMLRYAGLSFTPMTVQLTVGEYLKLLNNSLRTRTEAFIKTLDDQLLKPGQAKVRATVMNAAFTAAISTQSDKLITVTLWTLESVGALKARLAKAGELARSGAMPNVRAIGVGLGGLQRGLAQGVQELKIGASAAQLLARNALWDLEDAVKGYKPGTAPMLLSLGALWFQQDSLLRNYKALLEVASDERPEALAAVGSATFGVIGMGVEAAGFAVQVARPGWVVGLGTNVQTMGQKIARRGAFIAALAGMADAVQYAIASARTELQGDNSASTYYRYAAIASGFSAFAFIYVTFWTALALSVFVAGTIVMLLAYALSKKAKNLESTPVENWIKNSRWGLPENQRCWLKSDQTDDAVNALNIALMGISADISTQFRALTDAATSDGAVNPVFRDNASIPMGAWLDYGITLPQYEISLSSYTFTIFSSDELHSKKMPIANVATKGEFKITNSDIFASTLNDTSESFVEFYDPEAKILKVSGSIRLNDSSLPVSLEISVEYWTNKQVHSIPYRISHRN